MLLNVKPYIFWLKYLPSHILGYSRKKNRGELRIYFSENASGNFRFVTLSLEVLEKTSFHTTRFCKIVWHLLDIQKPRPMEIPHDFFLDIPENSTSFLIDPWNFHMLFLQYLWKIHVLNHPCLVFFLE